MEDKEILCPQEIYEKYLMTIDGIRFTPREIDIIACIMHGKNAKGTANFLSTKDKSLETKTIESHILNIKRKIAANSREGIISFIEKSDKYKLIHSYYSSLLIQQEFNKILQEILILTKSDKISFLIVLPRLGKNNLNLLVNKLCIDLRLIGITVSTEFQENPNATPIVVCLKHKEISATGLQLKQCTIYVLAVNEANVPDQEGHSSIIVDDDKEISKVFFLLAKEEQCIKMLSKQTSQTNFEYINPSLYKQYHFLFLEIITRLFPNTNIENIIRKFKERYSSIIENSSSIYPIPPPVNRDVQGNTKNIYILVFSVISIIALVMFCLCFFTLEPKANVNKTISSQGEESLFLTAQKSIISTKNLTTWNIPRQDHIFIGRRNLLDDLYNKLHHHHTPQTISSLAISACAGLGGIGKTQLALQYITHTKHPYTLKVWFPAENVDHLYNKYVEFAKLLGYAEVNYTKESIIAYVKQWLVDNPGWLLVYDNVNNYREIEAFLPKAGGYVILTTRQRHWPTNFSILPIDVMTEQEAVKTIRSLIQQDTAKEQNEIKKLVEILGYLPLALVQAGAYIRQNHITVLEYLYLYKSHEAELLASNILPEGTNNHPVAITWNISLEAIIRDTKINNEPPIAIELLTVCAYLAPDKISRKLLLAWLQAAYPLLSSPQLTLNKHIALLWQYSMINYTDSDHIAIHRLVQTVLRYQLQQGLDNKNNIYSILDLRWFELLLQFFIDHENDFKLTNSFQQLIETSKQFKSKFKDNYNENLATMDLIISSAYFHQEKYQDFFNLLQEVDRYLQRTDGLELLKCKILYLYSAYFCKMGNYQKAEEKINTAINRYNDIKVSKSIKANDLKNLNANLLFNKATLGLVKNKTTTKTNRNKLEIEIFIKSIQEAIALFNKTHNTRGFLRSIALYGKLLMLTNQANKVIIEFNKYTSLIEKIADDSTKIFFYLTYSDAYFSSGDYNKALNYCNKAKQQAEKLHLEQELNHIHHKENTIKTLLQKS
ncbi:NB-ARC domain-containing protein [Candidatus Tisiphia endosymbiont of Temnostethus pusillus]|uniref:DUF7779 domain-containing protein n=1 Tax=Candidatus Tisiphia endosymbiont of Temnostethus pusillus TaxID=3139335 RepID=UPI0035C8AC58